MTLNRLHPSGRGKSFRARIFAILGISASLVVMLGAGEPSGTPHQDDRYRGRQDEREGNRVGPEHEPPGPSPTPEPHV